MACSDFLLNIPCLKTAVGVEIYSQIIQTTKVTLQKE